MNFSIIVPVFNRPDEVEELLNSLSKQTQKNFEVVIVEDGSTEKCDYIAEKYSDKLSIQYFYKKNEKPAIARNYGARHAKGDYFLFFDSDCIIPEQYFEIVNKKLKENYTDAYGGPDAADPNFSVLQKAISYSMTSFFTTGGIRGGGEKLDKFYPRSFNMGISKTAFETIGGFPETKMHPGEDMVFSIEILKHGFKTQRIEDAFVYHKRRNTLKTFYKQVYKFGKTRWIITQKYPETFKIFFFAPSVFALGTIFLILLSLFSIYSLLPIAIYTILVFLSSLLNTKNISVAIVSIITSFFQLFAYGFGFLEAISKINLLKKDEFGVLKQGFYK